MSSGQAIARHLVFVLEGGEIVVQRGANVVESLTTNEQRIFNDFERDHTVTDAELDALLLSKTILAYDEMTIWLPPPDRRVPITYYYLDTKLTPAYLPMVADLLHSAALDRMYVAKHRMGRVAVMGSGGEPFDNISDAEHAYTLVGRVLINHIADLSIESIHVYPTITEENAITRPSDFEDLIRQTPVHSLADHSILIIEPTPEVSRHSELALARLGLEIRLAHIGEHALEILMDEEPDLVLIDLMLPDMHGYEIIAKIRKDPLTAQIPIIVMSDYVSEVDMVFALNVAQVDDYLLKPIEAQVLRHRTLALLNRQL